MGCDSIARRARSPASKKKQKLGLTKAEKVRDTRDLIQKKYIRCDKCHKYYIGAQPCPRCMK